MPSPVPFTLVEKNGSNSRFLRSRVHAMAKVLHFDRDKVAGRVFLLLSYFGVFRANFDRAARRRSFPRIDDQVQQDSIKLIAINEDFADRLDGDFVFDVYSLPTAVCKTGRNF